MMMQSSAQDGFSRMDESGPQGKFDLFPLWFLLWFGDDGEQEKLQPHLTAGHRVVRWSAPDGNFVIYIRPLPRSCHIPLRPVCDWMDKLMAHTHHSALHPHLRQPLASRGSAKTRAGSNHGEPTPLTSASRCGSVGPLLRPGERTTPDPPGEYDEARGSRPQDVVRGFFIETPFPAPYQRRTTTTDDEPSFHEPTKTHQAIR